MPRPTKDFTSANKAAWDASAPAHEAGESWDRLLAEASEPNFSTLDATLTETLAGLSLQGKTAVQIGCNNARDLLSLAALGIEPALGLDQSAAFLAQGAQLATAAGLSPRLQQADIYDVPDDLGTYHLGLITIGVLNWMPDLPGFFAAVAELIEPGGVLVIYETHPILEMLDPEGPTPFDLAYSYFDKGPAEVPEMIVYDGPTDARSGAVGYWFTHTLGEIVTTCVAAGFALERLEEHPYSNREIEYDKYENRKAQLPMSYTLVARRR